MDGTLLVEVHMPRAMVFVVAALLIGCVDEFVGPDRSGSMSFTFHGALADSPSGVFSVQGGRNSWPTGAGGQSDGSGTRISGSRDKRAAEEFSISVIGTMAVGPLPPCENSSAPPAPCVGFGFFSPNQNSTYGFGPSGQPPYPEMRMTIIDLTATRVRGTFEGIAVGYCVECRPAGYDTVTISGGAFDVPYR